MLLPNYHPNIIVLGDIMLDHEIYGTIEKLANEAPIPVLHQSSEKYSLGGCGNVVLNLNELRCNSLHVFSMIGKDKYADTIKSILSKYTTIKPYLYESDTYTTTVKNRGFCDNKIIFRYDIEQKKSIDVEHIRDILSKIELLITTSVINTIIFSDYNKGFLTKELCQAIIQLANKYSIFTCVDPKNDYTKYIGCSLIKPNRNEIELLFGKKISNTILDTHLMIKEKVKCDISLITLAEKGMSLCLPNNSVLHQSTQSTDVIDVTGAGDIVNSIISYYYPIIEEKQNILMLATYIASISVQHSGIYLIRPKDLINGFLLLNNSKLISVDHLISFQQAIVFTNGCFDILHKGHLELIEYCHSLCDNSRQLVIAINSDSSIQRLKGLERPINDISSRIAMLSALKWVNWIIVFDEDTPYTILSKIKPDILVKGGDYTADTIIGKEFCKDIKIFNYIPNKSTTDIINKIKQYTLS